jgi:hypothetical protein
MFIEILYYVSSVCIAILILLMIVFVVCFCRRLIKERVVFYKGYDLRPRVFLKLQLKWRSCDEGYSICTDCPNFDDCAMRAIRDVKDEVDKELENEK